VVVFPFAFPFEKQQISLFFFFFSRGRKGCESKELVIFLFIVGRILVRVASSPLLFYFPDPAGRIELFSQFEVHLVASYAFSSLWVPEILTFFVPHPPFFFFFFVQWVIFYKHSETSIIRNFAFVSALRRHKRTAAFLSLNIVFGFFPVFL